MKILITGGAGFIGSHITNSYLSKGHRVVVIDNLSTGRIENIQPFLNNYNRKNFYFVQNSILNEKILKRFVKKADMVIHLAAAVGVKFIIKYPLKSMETNVLGTENVLKYVKKYKKKVFIASSSEVYGDQIKAPLTENDSVVYGPSAKLRWSYAASKLVDEFLGLAIHRAYNVPVIIGRLFNIIGPNQVGDYGMVVPTFIKNALQGDPLIVHGTGMQTRTFTYIEDTVRAIHGLLSNESCNGEVFNIGASEEISIIELAEKIIRLTRSNSKIDLIPYEKVYGTDFDDMRRRVPDLSKIKRMIGFEPVNSLDDSLKKIANSINKAYF